MPNRKPTVSIVTPSYNQGEFIETTIRSVIRQDYPNVEYLVVDGASSDQTLAVLSHYEERLQWLSEPDQGQANAINKGFARTRGEILGWLNADDVYAPGAIAAAVEIMVARPEVMLVYGQANFIDARGTLIGPCAHVEPFDFRRLLNSSDFIVQPAAFFRRSAFEAMGGLDESLHWALDYDLWLKIGQRFQVAHLPRLMASSRWFGGNKTAVGGRARLAEVEKVARRYGARGLPAYFGLEAAALSLQQAWQATLRLDVGRAGICLSRAVTTLATAELAMQTLVSPKVWRVIWSRRRRIRNLLD